MRALMRLWAAAMMLLLALAGCSREGSPINSPYPKIGRAHV